MRLFWILAAMIPLAGCALPPAVSIISLGADFVSYTTTGKSITDLGISLVLEKDCALLRALEGNICVDPPVDDSETDLASLEHLSDTQIAAAYDDLMPLSADSAESENVTGRAQTTPVSDNTLSVANPRLDHPIPPRSRAAPVHKVESTALRSSTSTGLGSPNI
jgi:hypothetical protein